MNNFMQEKKWGTHRGRERRWRRGRRSWEAVSGHSSAPALPAESQQHSRTWACAPDTSLRGPPPPPPVDPWRRTARPPRPPRGPLLPTSSPRRRPVNRNDGQSSQDTNWLCVEVEKSSVGYLLASSENLQKHTEDYFEGEKLFDDFRMDLENTLVTHRRLLTYSSRGWEIVRRLPAD